MTAGTTLRVDLVRSHALDVAEREAVLELQMSAAQLEFAGAVAKSVAACEAGDPAEVAGLAIRVAGDIVGWVGRPQARHRRAPLDRGR